MTWSLVNVEERAAEHATFKIPSRSVREKLCVGDLVKLVFVTPAGEGERMWVEIGHAESGRYSGRLRNTPVRIRDLGESAFVEFGPEHVADWEVG
jgi:hypothetical protein